MSIITIKKEEENQIKNEMEIKYKMRIYFMDFAMSRNPSYSTSEITRILVCADIEIYQYIEWAREGRQEIDYHREYCLRIV